MSGNTSTCPRTGTCPMSGVTSTQAPKTKNRVFVIGVGMTKFIKPGKPENPDYHIMAKQAVNRALKDSGVSYTKI